MHIPSTQAVPYGLVLSILIAAGSSTTVAADAPLPVSAFFGNDAMSQPVLSPNGKFLAVRVAGGNGRYQLAVITLEPPRQGKIVGAFPNADVADVKWVNDDRLAFWTYDALANTSDQQMSGMFAVDRNGEQARLLGRGAIFSALRDGSSDVLIIRPSMDPGGREVLSRHPYRKNTLTGRETSVETGLGKAAMQWWGDDKGRAKLAYAVSENNYSLYLKSKPDQPWAEIDTGDRYGSKPGSFAPRWIAPNGDLYVSRYVDIEGTGSALHRFDPEAGKPDPDPVLTLKGYDFSGRPLFDGKTQKLTGVRYTTDAAGTVWFDPDMKALQAEIDKARPGMINLLYEAECGCGRWVLVTSFSDQQPHVYYLYDRDKKVLELVGQKRPNLDAKRMARRDFERIKARDGLQIPVHITRPSGTGPWPAVVLVHGGPWVRGSEWAWDEQSQFLASRGYLVIEPEFRGSTGYGKALFEAGIKQWGLKMQDDVADATRWAVQQGLADSRRVCIAGASYGGYSTLMGLIRDPDLYRCGVAWVAVSDINLMYDLHWSDFSEAYKEYGMPTLIGDRVKDAAQLEATSPLKQAARITQPLLLAYGGADRRVPIQHGTRFRDAVTKTNTQVQWIEYIDEGHGWRKPENRYDFWTRVEQFLGTHLGAPK